MKTHRPSCWMATTGWCRTRTAHSRHQLLFRGQSQLRCMPLICSQTRRSATGMCHSRTVRYLLGAPSRAFRRHPATRGGILGQLLTLSDTRYRELSEPNMWTCAPKWTRLCQVRLSRCANDGRQLHLHKVVPTAISMHEGEKQSCSARWHRWHWCHGGSIISGSGSKHSRKCRGQEV
jgi:hypothetical protein